MIDIVFSKENLIQSWRLVKEKNRTGGIDNITITEFEKKLCDNLDQLSTEIISGEYIPEPYKRIYIDKDKKSEKRPLAMLAVRDKITQVCFMSFFYNKIEKTFIDTSYAYRAGKGHNKAINRIRDFISRHNNFVCTIDIDNFFDSINRQILLSRCNKLFTDNKIIKLLEMWIKIGVIHKGKYIDSELGIAQGGVISPMLSNIYLNSYDAEMKNNNFNNVRYADNIILLEKNKEKLYQSLYFTKTYLKNELKLELNRIDKECINASVDSFTFCGIQFTKGERKIDPQKFNKIKNNISDLLNKSIFNNPNLILKLNEHLNGIVRYYRAFDTNDQVIEIEEHLLNSLAEKLNLELKSGNIKSFRDSKIVLNNISFLTPKTRSEKEVLIKKILDKSAENRRKSVKSEAESAVNKKKRHYQKIWFENLDVLISGAYSQIGKSGYKITIRKEGKLKTEMSADRVKNILISANAVTISSDAVKLCSDKNIRINYFDSLGKPYATIISSGAPVNLLFNRQSETLTTTKAAIIAKNIVVAKIKNQLSVVKYFTKNKKENAVLTEIVVNEIASIKDILEKVKLIDIKIDLHQLREKLMGYEGSAAVSYWKLFREFVPEEYNFEKREHRWAENVVNIMLNYAYGILYTRILSAVTLSGLNPNISFLHTEQKDKPALVFDLIEIFRAPVADRTVIAILNKGVKVGIDKKLLSEKTKSLLAKKVLTRLNSEFIHRGKITSFNQLIIEQVKSLVSYINNDEKIFRTYLSKW